jgi:hypothetical protein
MDVRFGSPEKLPFHPQSVAHRDLPRWVNTGRKLCSIGTLFLLGSLHSFYAQAQRQVTLQAEGGTFVPRSGQTPFWLKSNQYGIVPFRMPVATVRARMAIDYDSIRLFTRRLTVGGGLSIIGNAGERGGWLLPEAYLKARLGVIEFYVGRRRELFGFADSTLSTGSYAWSGNALPVPKVQVEIRSFTPLGFTKGFVSVKGSFAHGWLGGQYVQHTLLHQKSFYLRLGKPRSRLKMYGGLNHQVVWGGQSRDLLKTGIGLTKGTQLPSSFRDYISLVSGLRSVNSGVIDSSAYSDFDLTNRVGNHLGSVDIALELTTHRFSYYLYRENPYETGALFYGTSLADGLNGLRIRSADPKAIIQQVLIEYLYTANQGGPEFVITDPKRRGRVDYFNHAQYRDGWSYQGQGLGTPFISPSFGANGDLPYGGFTRNNRVEVWHLGIAGNLFRAFASWLLGPVTYQSKLSYSRNLGTYLVPFPHPLYQFSGIVRLLVPLSILQGITVTSSFSIDQGGLYPNTMGFYFGIRKDWSPIIR